MQHFVLAPVTLLVAALRFQAVPERPPPKALTREAVVSHHDSAGDRKVLAGETVGPHQLQLAGHRGGGGDLLNPGPQPGTHAHIAHVSL